ELTFTEPVVLSNCRRMNVGVLPAGLDLFATPWVTKAPSSAPEMPSLAKLKTPRGRLFLLGLPATFRAWGQLTCPACLTGRALWPVGLRGWWTPRLDWWLTSPPPPAIPPGVPPPQLKVLPVGRMTVPATENLGDVPCTAKFCPAVSVTPALTRKSASVPPCR